MGNILNRKQQFTYRKAKNVVAQQRTRARKFGLTLGQFRAIFDIYPTCFVCGNNKLLRIDHNHVTGKNRGVLCNSDNLILGHVKDNVGRLRKLADYLENNWETNSVDIINSMGVIIEPEITTNLNDPVIKLILDAIKLKVINRSSSWYSYLGYKQNGVDKFILGLVGKNRRCNAPPEVLENLKIKMFSL